MSEKASAGTPMRDAVSVLAGQWGPVETRESWLARAARRAGVSYRTIKAVWYGEIDNPDHKAAQQILEAAERHGRREAGELAARLETLTSALRAIDEDFHGPQIDALSSAVVALRVLDRTRVRE